MKIERKYLAHYIDAGSLNFGKEVAYSRIGKDLEEYVEDLGPDVEVKKNILGEQTVDHNGYEAQSEVDPFYADENDALYSPLETIALERKTGDACKTTKVDVLLTEDGKVKWAYREDVYVVPNSIGGDTSGVQIPYTIYNAGNRVKGDWDVETKTFTPAA
jgi:hypothetical protein